MASFNPPRPPSDPAQPYEPCFIAPASNAADAFGRFRVSNPVQVFASSHNQDDQADLWFNELTGGGTATHDRDRASMLLTVTNIGDKVIRETRQAIPYRPGQSQRPTMTFVMGAAEAGVRKRVGLFDDANGLFFEQTATGGYNLVVRSSVSGAPVDNAVARADWDGYGFDGTAPFFVTGDPAMGQILDMDFQWLGMGEVRFGFAVRDAVARAHSFSHAGEVDSVYMSTGTLPLRYEIEAVGAPAQPATLEAVCATVNREGSAEEPAAVSAIDSLVPHALTLNQAEAILGLRLRAANLAASLSAFSVNVLACDNATAARYKWELIIDPTFSAAPTWAGDWADAADTEFCQVARPSGVNVVTPGTGRKIASGFFTSGRSGGATAVKAGENLTLSRRDFTTAQELVLVVTPIVTGSGLSAAGSINFRELH